MAMVNTLPLRILNLRQANYIFLLNANAKDTD
jgi:hypothetical protein